MAACTCCKAGGERALCQAQTAAARGRCGRLQPAPPPAADLCPVNECVQYVPAVSHTFTVLSALAVASMAPERSTAIPITGALCPCREVQQALGIRAAWHWLHKPLAAALGQLVCLAQPACGCIQQGVRTKMHSTVVQPCRLLICLWDVKSLPSWQLEQQPTSACPCHQLCMQGAEAVMPALPAARHRLIAFKPACNPILAVCTSCVCSSRPAHCSIQVQGAGWAPVQYHY